MLTQIQLLLYCASAKGILGDLCCDPGEYSGVTEHEVADTLAKNAATNDDRQASIRRVPHSDL